MELQEHYNQLWNDTKQKFEADEFGVDPLLYDENDKRYGVTLLIRPAQSVVESIGSFLEEVRLIEPDLYFYPPADLHLTVMSIISCYEGFQLDQINQDEHRDLIQASLGGIKPFQLKLKGITAAPSAIMVQGFPDKDGLNVIRDSLREHYKNSELKSRMDVRYAISTSHSTVIRFPQKPQNPKALLELLEKYRSYDFGSYTINQLEFVYNDWYQRSAFVQKLGMFELVK